MVELYCVATTVNGKTACGVLLLYKNGDDTFKRTMAFATNTATNNAVHMRAVYVALASLNDSLLKDNADNITIFTSNIYVQNMLQIVDGDYNATPKSNQEEVTAARSYYDLAGRPEVKKALKNDYMTEALELAKYSAEHQVNKDTGTVKL